jgi:Tol biopolymer transport system component
MKLEFAAAADVAHAGTDWSQVAAFPYLESNSKVRTPLRQTRNRTRVGRVSSPERGTGPAKGGCAVADRRVSVFLAVLSCFSSPLIAQVTERVSVATSGSQGNGDSSMEYSGGSFVSVSGDGRYVAFDSIATNLVPGDTNGCDDVFVRDRISGTTERVSVDSQGLQGNNRSLFPSISADGRFVAFVSLASNLVEGDTNQEWDVFVRDRSAGVTTRVNLGPGGAQVTGDGGACLPAISADGRFVAFQSNARGLVHGTSSLHFDIFVHDLQNGVTELASVSSDGTEGNSNSQTPTISGDGRYVAFVSLATNLVPNSNGEGYETYVHDRLSGVTTMESVSPSGTPANGWSGLAGIAISSDGRYIAFDSWANNLAPPISLSDDIYFRDRQSGTIVRVSVDPSGNPANGPCVYPSMSPDGRYVAFVGLATNLVSGDTNGRNDVFVRDRLSGTTDRVSTDSAGAQGNGDSAMPSISEGGRYVAFASGATNLVNGDTNSAFDVFVHDSAATGFTSLCNPDLEGVIACPCANSPSGPGRGCDNSAATGGARLSATGIGYLSLDSIAFTTSGEKPSALSIVMQGNGAVPAGVVYGQGVRCLGGTIIRRLFIKQAIAGSVTAPDFGAGDPAVSVRSAAKGDVIQPGQSRYHLVYYRDPTVLGGCPASATFNATQTGEVTWWP